MKILGIDTAHDNLEVGIWDEQIVSAHIVDAPRQHGSLGAVLINECLDDSRMRPGDLDFVAVNIGPGLLTGLRVGVAMAKAFALSIGAQVIPICQLDILASGVGDAQDVCCAIDAKRGEVFCQWFHMGKPVSAPELAMPEEIVTDDRTTANTVFVGSAVDAYPDQFPGDASVSPKASIETLLQMAAARTDLAIDASDVVPVYLRKSDAEIFWESKDVGD